MVPGSHSQIRATRGKAVPREARAGTGANIGAMINGPRGRTDSDKLDEREGLTRDALLIFLRTITLRSFMVKDSVKKRINK